MKGSRLLCALFSILFILTLLALVSCGTDRTGKTEETKETEAASSEVLTTENVTTENVTTENVTTENVTTKNVTTKTVTTEIVTTENVTTENVTTEIVTTEIVTTKPVTTAPVTKPITPSTLKLTADYAIITPANPSEMEKYGAEVVRDKIRSLSGATLPIKTDAESESDKEILIGNTNRALSKSARAGLSANDFAIVIDGEKIAVTGANVYHSFVGVDHFVKEMIGNDAEIRAENYVFDYETMDPEADETKLGTLAEIYKSIADPSGRLMLCAHRGDHINLPANAIVGITSAIENAEADMVEIDLQKTKDGYWVLCHDPTLSNTTDCGKYIGKAGWPTDAYVSSWTLAQIRQLKLENSDYTMPTFEEILDVSRGKVLLVLDKVVSSGGLSACEELYGIAWRHCAVETLMYQCYTADALPDSFFQKIFSETGIRLVRHFVTSDTGEMRKFIASHTEKEYVIETMHAFFDSDFAYTNSPILSMAAGKCRVAANTLNGKLGLEKDRLSSWKTLYEAGFSMIQTDEPYKLRDYVLQTIKQGGRTGDLKNGEDLTIGGASDWQVFADKVAAGTTFDRCTVTLSQDIDFGGALIKPVGTADAPFMGTIVGNGHTLKNFTIDAGNAPAALIGTACNAKISDLMIENASVRGSALQAAGLVAGAYFTEISGCRAENITVTSTSTSNSYTESGKGGLIGYATDSKITNCSVTGVTITGHRDVGGTFGDIANCTVENCTAENVSVTATGNSVGAFTGNNHSSVVTNCKVSGKVSTAGSNFGAFVGYSDGEHTYNGCEADVENKSLPAIGRAANAAKGAQILLK